MDRNPADGPTLVEFPECLDFTLLDTLSCELSNNSCRECQETFFDLDALPLLVLEPEQSNCARSGVWPEQLMCKRPYA